jgi:RNA polymerase sigma-70 factor, ECF subfamily
MAEIALDYEQLSDVELASFVVRRDPHAVRVITQRNNQRLYRAARSILKDSSRSGGCRAGFLSQGVHLDASVAGASSLSTWLTRIVINEALERSGARKGEATS